MKILAALNPFDEPYVMRIKDPIYGLGHTAIVTHVKIETKTELLMAVKKAKADAVITTQQSIIAKVFPTVSDSEQLHSDYVGSYTELDGIPLVVLPNLRQSVSVPYGQFLIDRYISKITKPEKWLVADDFSFKLMTSVPDYEACFASIEASDLCAIDIETRPDLSLSSIAFTTLSFKELKTRNFVLPLPNYLPVHEYEFIYAWIAKLVDTDTPKIMQGGRYDIAYLNRYHCPVRSYLCDMMMAHYCWYSEMPKDLGFISAFYIKNSYFWKKESDDLYRYNALDTWGTMWAWLQWLYEAPNWAKNNYINKFPIMFPSILCEGTGLLVSELEMAKHKNTQEIKAAKALSEVQTVTNCSTFNPNSPKQVKTLINILGAKDIVSTEEKYLKQVAYRHPFNNWIIERIIDVRKANKLISTYLQRDKLFNGRMLYSLLPYGTTTGRNSSSEHAFWTGANIQNIPRGSGIKSMYVADDDFVMFECDKAQAESRYTGYISGDTVLIDAVESENDFHSFNAAKFFGVNYEDICTNIRDDSGKVIGYKYKDKELRQLGKPVNHGKNYNMGDQTLVDTMGLVNIYKAGARLGLGKKYAPVEIAKYLGRQFASTYRILTGKYYDYVAHTIKTTKMLVGATGWTRYCFGNPDKNKMDLNAYIAHAPQSLSAMNLDKAFMDVFRYVWRPNKHNFKLHAQIHDSILFQTRKGYEYLANKVSELMTRSTEVTDMFGITRTMIVPVDLSKSGNNWQECKDE